MENNGSLYIEANGLIDDLELMAKFQPEYKRSTILGVCATIRCTMKHKGVNVPKVIRSSWTMIPVDGVARYRCGNLDCARLIPRELNPIELKFCPYCGVMMEGVADV